MGNITGDTLKHEIRYTNTDMKTIKLSKGYSAIVDDCDYSQISAYKWHAIVSVGGRRVYAHNNVLGPMHRFLLSVNNPKIIIDHKDGNALNNTRDNLRVATSNQNQFNRRKIKPSKSKYKGLIIRRGVIEVRIQFHKKLIHVGTFKNESEAALAYNKKATELFGEFANLNVL